IDGSIWAVAVPSAGVEPASPVYQETVFWLVPATREVAVANGGPSTRKGGLAASVLKKSFAAAMAEAAVSDVPAMVLTPLVSAAWRLVAVAAGVAPMVNCPVAGG